MINNKLAAPHASRCVNIIQNCDQHNLYFQDQCALNLAFNNHVGVLSQEYNYFVFPDGNRGHIDECEAHNIVIYHFLDKPKPWYLEYKQVYRGDKNFLLKYEKYVKLTNRVINDLL